MVDTERWHIMPIFGVDDPDEDELEVDELEVDEDEVI